MTLRSRSLIFITSLGTWTSSCLTRFNLPQRRQEQRHRQLKLRQFARRLEETSFRCGHTFESMIVQEDLKFRPRRKWVLCTFPFFFDLTSSPTFSHGYGTLTSAYWKLAKQASCERHAEVVTRVDPQFLSDSCQEIILLTEESPRFLRMPYPGNGNC